MRAERRSFSDILTISRSVVLAKLQDLPDEQLRTSLLPSGWTPLGLLKHLTYVEMRWFGWGFEGGAGRPAMGDSWEGRWFVSDDETLPTLAEALQRQAERTRAIVRAHKLTEIGQPGERGGAHSRQLSNASCSTSRRNTPDMSGTSTSSVS